jgi:hypothetical protein
MRALCETAKQSTAESALRAKKHYVGSFLNYNNAHWAVVIVDDNGHAFLCDSMLKALTKERKEMANLLAEIVLLFTYLPYFELTPEENSSALSVEYSVPNLCPWSMAPSRTTVAQSLLSSSDAIVRHFLRGVCSNERGKHYYRQRYCKRYALASN